MGCPSSLPATCKPLLPWGEVGESIAEDEGEEDEPEDGSDEVGDDEVDGWASEAGGRATKDWADEGAVMTNSTAMST